MRTIVKMSRDREWVSEMEYKPNDLVVERYYRKIHEVVIEWADVAIVDLSQQILLCLELEQVLIS